MTSTGDDTIDAAIQFVKYAYKPGTGFVGTVQFQVTDNSTGGAYTKSIQVKSGDEDGVCVHDGDPPPEITVNCTVKVEKTILLAILTGVLDPALAFMFGQLAVDNIPVMTTFVKAFEFKKEKFDEFQQTLVSQVKDQGDTGETSEKIDIEKKSSFTDVKVNNETTIESIGSPKTRELKQTLAINGLKFIVAVRNMAKEVDAIVTRAKDADQVQNAFSQLAEETSKLQASDVYQKVQSNSTFSSLKEELSKATTVITAKAKDMSLMSRDVVESLTKTAYPAYVPSKIDLSVHLPDNPPPLISSSPVPWPSVPLSLSSSPSPPRTPLSSAPPPLFVSLPSSSTSTPVQIPGTSSGTSSPSISPSTPTTPTRLSILQSFKTAISSSPTLSRREPKETDSIEKEREAKERAAREEREKEERQREEKRRQLQAKLEQLQKQNEETSRQKQDDARKKLLGQEKRREELVQKQIQQPQLSQDSQDSQDPQAPQQSQQLQQPQQPQQPQDLQEQDPQQPQQSQQNTQTDNLQSEGDIQNEIQALTEKQIPIQNPVDKIMESAK